MNRRELIEIRLELIKRSFGPGQDPLVIAVTKKRPMEDVLFAYDAGVRDFGENRVDDLIEKSAEAVKLGLDDIRWHFIGNIQSKKIQKLFSIKNLVALHSVDSFEQLGKLFDKSDILEDRILDIFFQVNTSAESEKSGFSDWDNLAASVNSLLKYEKSLRLKGLMTMSKIRTNNFRQDAKKCFAQLRKIKISLEKDFDIKDLKLSMGMSNDYEIALDIGTDYLRLGSALFAPQDD